MLEVALSDVDRKLHFHVISVLELSLAKTNDRRNSGKMFAFEGLLAIASDVQIVFPSKVEVVSRFRDWPGKELF